ncbi:PIN domain-containing protein [Parasphingorhabdus sp.]|uniref:PIN domain-containing protein n=1 Tax=Parasphingorhabdus sp. TaxID=2709688 RepID=UPI003A8E8CCC
MIIVDTNVWREISHAQGNQRVKKWFVDQESELLLSSIVLSEMLYGVCKMDEGRRKQLMLGWYERLEAEFSDRILDYDRKCASAFGELANEIRVQGLDTGVMDTMIAAQAVANATAIATRNAKDFAFADIAVIDPWAA